MFSRMEFKCFLEWSFCLFLRRVFVISRVECVFSRERFVNFSECVQCAMFSANRVCFHVYNNITGCVCFPEYEVWVF